MKSRLILATAAVFALSFVTVGTSSATAVCDPHCSVKGLTKANDAAKVHSKAPGNPGVVVVASGGDGGGGTGDSGGGDPGTSNDTNTTTSTDPGPCSGC
ncbi:MAG: hypothetical protein OEY86_03260 [Nitrospira sp.]|nr:hypothetical protein [Nitrospira sp.]